MGFRDFRGNQDVVGRFARHARAQTISACRRASRSAGLWKIHARADDGARAELPASPDHRRAAGFLREMRELCPHRTGE